MTGAIIVFVVAALAITGLIFFLVRKAKQKAPVSVTTGGPPLADVQRAFQVVWIDTYGMLPSRAPRVTWVTSEMLNCHDGLGWTNEGECVAGVSWKDLNSSAVAWPPGIKISDSAFAHELLHAVGWVEGKPTDHFSSEFQAQVAVANAALKKVGL